MTYRFTQELWESIDDTYRAILKHPFIRELEEGTLDRHVFRFYVIQDALYLHEYAQVLAICAAKAPNPEGTLMFTDHASNAITVERSLHEGFFSDLEVQEAEVNETKMAPTSLAYVSYLKAAAYGGSFPEALGAVMPCYLIYEGVGKAFLEHSSPNQLYRRWIETYGGDDFASVVDAVRTLADKIGPSLSATEKDRVAERFQTTAKYEWMFWDMAYEMEEWRV